MKKRHPAYRVTVAIVALITFGAQLPVYAGPRENSKGRSTTAQPSLYTPPQLQVYEKTRDAFDRVSEPKKNDDVRRTDGKRDSKKGADKKAVKAAKEFRKAVQKFYSKFKRDRRGDPKTRFDKKENRFHSERQCERAEGQNPGGDPGTEPPVVVEPPVTTPPVVDPPVVEPPVAEPPVVEPPVVTEPDPVEPDPAEPDPAEPDPAEPPAAEPSEVGAEDPDPVTPPASPSAVDLGAWTVTEQTASPDGTVTTTYVPPAGTSEFSSIHVVTDPVTGTALSATAVRQVVLPDSADLSDTAFMDLSIQDDGSRVETYLSSDSLKEYRVHYDVSGVILKIEMSETISLSLEQILL